MCKLHKEVAPDEAVQIMCEKSDGAIMACNELLGYFSHVFPRCSGEEITSLKTLDELGIYGRDIAMLYFHTYNGDTRKMLLALNAYCVGRIDEKEVLRPHSVNVTIH
jgi:hypothetical protein